MDFHVGYSESVDHVGEERLDRCWFELMSYHQKNPDTGRTFHGDVPACLEWPQVRQLHAYLGFLLAQVAPKEKA